MKLKRLGWMLLCILSAVSLSLGQTATTSLRGTIKDPSGALVPGAKITITDKTVGTTFSAMADTAATTFLPRFRQRDTPLPLPRPDLAISLKRLSSL